MKTHPDLDVLSALAAGDLDDAERAQAEAHVPTCSACAATVDALRATVLDLRGLGEAEMPGEVEWALRGALRKAAARPHRVARWTMAAGGVAAAIVALFAFSGLNRSAPDTAAAPANRQFNAADLGVEQDPTDYNATTVRALLDDSVRTTFALGAPPNSAKTAPAVARAGVQPGAENADASTQHAGADPAQACDSSVRASVKNALTLERTIAATYRGTPVFILIYSASDHRELWVVTRDHCAVRYFAQAKT